MSNRMIVKVGAGSLAGRGGCLFVAYLSHLPVDHAHGAPGGRPCAQSSGMQRLLYWKVTRRVGGVVGRHSPFYRADVIHFRVPLQSHGGVKPTVMSAGPWRGGASLRAVAGHSCECRASCTWGRRSIVRMFVSTLPTSLGIVSTVSHMIDWFSSYVVGRWACFARSLSLPS